MPWLKVTCHLFSGSSMSPAQVVLRSFKPLINLQLLHSLPAELTGASGSSAVFIELVNHAPPQSRLNKRWNVDGTLLFGMEKEQLWYQVGAAAPVPLPTGTQRHENTAMAGGTAGSGCAPGTGTGEREQPQAGPGSVLNLEPWPGAGSVPALRPCSQSRFCPHTGTPVLVLFPHSNSSSGSVPTLEPRCRSQFCPHTQTLVCSVPTAEPRFCSRAQFYSHS